MIRPNQTFNKYWETRTNWTIERAHQTVQEPTKSGVKTMKTDIFHNLLCTVIHTHSNTHVTYTIKIVFIKHTRITPSTRSSGFWYFTLLWINARVVVSLVHFCQYQQIRCILYAAPMKCSQKHSKMFFGNYGKFGKFVMWTQIFANHMKITQIYIGGQITTA